MFPRCFSPRFGTTLTGSSVTFGWTVSPGISQVWLDVGTTVGGSQIYSATQGTGSSRTVSAAAPSASLTLRRLFVASAIPQDVADQRTVH